MSTAAPTLRSTPKLVRFSLPLFKLLVLPLVLLFALASKLTGRRPWLAVLLLLGVSVIGLHARTLSMRQLMEERSVRVQDLQRHNQTLRSQVASLGRTDRITQVAQLSGLDFPKSQGISNVTASAENALRAANAITAPSTAWVAAPGAVYESDAPASSSSQAAAPTTSTTPAASATTPTTATPPTKTTTTTTPSGLATASTGAATTGSGTSGSATTGATTSGSSTAAAAGSGSSAAGSTSSGGTTTGTATAGQ